MNQRQIEDYLTEYQPELKAELLTTDALQAYLDELATAMQEARQRILAQLRQHEPTMSETQRQIEADQTVRALFLPVR